MPSLPIKFLPSNQAQLIPTLLQLDSAMDNTPPAAKIITMHPKFPQNIFDRFIDAYGEVSDVNCDIRSLLSCALVCSAWHDRSQINLYRHVKIVSCAQFTKFMYLLALHSDYGDLVRRLSIVVGSSIPARTIITSLLPKLNKLDRLDIDHTPVKPNASFFAVAQQYPLITTLSLCGDSFTNTNELVTFITSFPALQTLRVSHEGSRPPQTFEFDQALSDIDLAHLRTVQLELYHSHGRPRDRVGPNEVAHLIDWLTRSPTAIHLERLWVLMTAENDKEDYEAASCITNLLEACGESLQELIVQMQVTDKLDETWFLDGLGMSNSLNSKQIVILK